MVSVRKFDSPAERVAALAECVALTLLRAVQARGRAGLIVSGGSTPRPVFATLALHDLPWDAITITLADERWVAPDQADSNERLLRDTLLQAEAANARFIPLKNAAANAAAGLAQAERDVNAFPWPADVLMLGMGDDGHTASLFPGAPELQTALSTSQRCIAVTPPAAPHQRMSLSAHALLESRLICIDITGPAKWARYVHAASTGPVDLMPVRVVLQQDQVPVQVYWSP